MHEKDEMPFIVGDYDTAQLLQDLQVTTMTFTNRLTLLTHHLDYYCEMCTGN
jgi:hypothetical protein